MKKLLVVLLTVALLFSMAACTKTPEPEKQPDDPTTNPTLSLQDVLNKVPEATHYDWADDLPRMDGSTSTIPLEAGIRAALFGISQAEAELQVTHSTTYGSFYNLIDGNCDLIFSVPLSEEQIKQAGDKGIELEMTAIAAEGFVFVVNAKNPVDTLTQQQLKDIYSGKITNWKEVGGNDAPIIAYQRNETSGSQNFMHTFMGDTPLMEPVTDMTPSEMGHLMDAVAYYDNAEHAIGYSVYAYAADMYGNGNEIKFIHVDGVKPTKATMADGSYPLLGYNYAVYAKSTPADSNLRKLVEWIGTDEGQRAVKAAGYVPLRPVGEMSEPAAELYKAVGTGPAKPEGHTLPIYQYTVDNWGESLIERDEKGNAVCLRGLTNQTLLQEINTFFDTAVAELTRKFPLYDCFIDADVKVINGYMSIVVDVHPDKGNGFDETHFRTAFYDLTTAKRIAFSDLFYKGVDFATAINRQIQERVFFSELKRPFYGIPAGHDAFSFNTVYFTMDSLYFDSRYSFPVIGLKNEMVLYQPRDMQGLFEPDVPVVREFLTEAGQGEYHGLAQAGEDSYAVQLMDEQVYDKALCDKVNGAVKQHFANELSEQAMSDWVQKRHGAAYSWRYGSFNLNFTMLGDRYVFYRDRGWVNITRKKDNVHVSSELFGVIFFFDAKTGEEFPYTTLLKEGWEKAGSWYIPDEAPHISNIMDTGTPIDTPTLADKRLIDLQTYGGGIRLAFHTNGTDNVLIVVNVPDAYVNWNM